MTSPDNNNNRHRWKQLFESSLDSVIIPLYVPSGAFHKYMPSMSAPSLNAAHLICICENEKNKTKILLKHIDQRQIKSLNLSD